MGAEINMHILFFPYYTSPRTLEKSKRFHLIKKCTKEKSLLKYTGNKGLIINHGSSRVLKDCMKECLNRIIWIEETIGIFSS